MSRAEVQQQERARAKQANPMNRLVPYLDLFGRLSDDELARVSGVMPAVVNDLRNQVIQVDQALSRFADLLPRLSDTELVRLTGATPKTIRFWRLCQPRFGMAGANAEGWSVAKAAEALSRVRSSAELIQRQPSAGHRAAEAPLDSGAPVESRGHREHEVRPTEEMHRMETGTHPAADARASGDTSRRYRMPTNERDGGSSDSVWRKQGAQQGAQPGAPQQPLPSSRTEETPVAASAAPPSPNGTPEPPDVRRKQDAVSKQMTFSGDPFPGYDDENPQPAEDGIFIGLELPDPRTLMQPGQGE